MLTSKTPHEALRSTCLIDRKKEGEDEVESLRLSFLCLPMMPTTPHEALHSTCLIDREKEGDVCGILQNFQLKIC